MSMMKKMDKALLSLQMEINIKGSFKIANFMVKGFIFMKMVIRLKVSFYFYCLHVNAFIENYY